MGTPGTKLPVDKPRYEREWANTEALLRLSKPDYKLWEAMRHVSRLHVRNDTALVQFRTVDGGQCVDEIWRASDLRVSFTTGIWLTLRNRHGGEFNVTHMPTKVPGSEIFMWLPYFNELRWNAKNWNDPQGRRELQLALAFKSMTDIDQHFKEDTDYVLELSKFNKRWPEEAAQIKL